MTKFSHPAIGFLIKKRKELGISQVKLVGLMEYEVSLTSVEDWESGKYSPKLENLNRWAKALGYEVALKRASE